MIDFIRAFLGYIIGSSAILILAILIERRLK